MATPTGEDRLLAQLGGQVLAEITKFYDYMDGIDKTLGKRMKNASSNAQARKMIKAYLPDIRTMYGDIKRGFSL